jgi:paraquat-inducible protein B
LKVLIPVYVEINPASFKAHGEGIKPDPTFKRQIEKGMRAQIKMQSLVTGQLMIYVDYFPDKPLRLVKAEPRYPEIPTTPSGTEEIIKALEQIPVKEIAAKAASALEGIERLINSPAAREVVVTLNSTLKDYQKVAGKVDGALEDVRLVVNNVGAKIESLAAETKGTLGDARNLIQGADKEIIPLAASLKKTLDEAGGVLDEARQALKKASAVISDESVLSSELIGTMDEINKTMRSIQLLAEYLKQHPEALLWGKSPGGGK